MDSNRLSYLLVYTICAYAFPAIVGITVAAVAPSHLPAKAKLVRNSLPSPVRGRWKGRGQREVGWQAMWLSLAFPLLGYAPYGLVQYWPLLFGSKPPLGVVALAPLAAKVTNTTSTAPPTSGPAPFQTNSMLSPLLHLAEHPAHLPAALRQLFLRRKPRVRTPGPFLSLTNERNSLALQTLKETALEEAINI